MLSNVRRPPQQCANPHMAWCIHSADGCHANKRFLESGRTLHNAASTFVRIDVLAVSFTLVDEAA